MKPKSVAPQSAVMAVDRKLHNTWVYIKRHWQLYLLFLMPAVRWMLREDGSFFSFSSMGEMR